MALLSISLTSTTDEAFPKRDPRCWRPLFPGFRLRAYHRYASYSVGFATEERAYGFAT